MVRGDEAFPWGYALKQALERKASLWDHKTDLLVRRSARALEPSTPDRAAKGKGKKGKGSSSDFSPPPPALLAVKKEETGKGSEVKRQWVTARYDKNNNTICKKYNDARGCGSTCPMGFQHVCDVVLANGKVCGAKAHNRRSHRVAEHGAPKIGW